ncbi:hypothetical protein EKO27_g6154 [Xylaria grammica]|uniref:Aminoacyl-transfer RNA synthetases class-II family profile domain-containing protein n=1 Tax=Xylaria grammica TaxID=363999 RepID=A0A439D3H4_9PEZI|nr:hypothetical protein EKO27_g6154 [Xylaria grammica]
MLRSEHSLLRLCLIRAGKAHKHTPYPPSIPKYNLESHVPHIVSFSNLVHLPNPTVMTTPTTLTKMAGGWRFVLHGGCAETCPDAARQQHILRNLQEVSEIVSDRLAKRVKARDVVALAVSALEDRPVFNVTQDGVHQLEAVIVDGASSDYGAVGCTEQTKNPILVAHSLSYHFTTPFPKAHWDQTTESGQREADLEMGTVGAVVLDSHGHIAAGGSMGGPAGKMNGRIGGTAILGAGLYADTQLGVVCSGSGDQIFKHSVAAQVAKYHTSGTSLREAARQALIGVAAAGTSCALAAVDAEGNIVIEYDVKNGSVLCQHYEVERCALVTEGNNCLSLIPLHGLTKDWKPIISDLKEFHETFPGYVSSKDGPMIAADTLDDVCLKVQKASGLTTPFNYRFDGDPCNTNLFSRIIRGELGQYRVWENEDHVAFLTPFANTPGFTVLVPRRHLPSDIFSIDKASFRKLMTAAHRVAAHLKDAFGVSRCGMIFEGFEIDYAHVKLIPIHTADVTYAPYSASGPSPAAPITTVAPFQETYQGYVSSLSGPLCKDTESLAVSTLKMRSKHHVKTHILPPRSWGCPSSHRTTVLQHPWYQKLFFTQDAIFHASVAFFQKRLGYKYCFVPVTTNAVNSPMGLGSDSDPVPILFLGQKTHLADSMQFSLEYFLRIADGVPGVYYINTSFRGEDPDAMHLNQFYHVECELLGPFSEGIRVAETYVTNLVSTLLQDHKELVETVAGTTDHLVAFLEHHRSHDCKLSQITVDDALGLPIMDATCWKYILAPDPSRGRTITRAGELKLIEHFGGPVWLTEMDHLGGPFYQAFTDETRQKARCADLLLGNGEVLGLGERHVSAEHVRAALRQYEIPPGGYAWYGEIREQKAILTTGWGMGVERFLAWVFRHDDIRDMAIIPRMKGLSFAP